LFLIPEVLAVDNPSFKHLHSGNVWRICIHVMSSKWKVKWYIISSPQKLCYFFLFFFFTVSNFHWENWKSALLLQRIVLGDFILFSYYTNTHPLHTSTESNTSEYTSERWFKWENVTIHFTRPFCWLSLSGSTLRT
jgi:hypothetical protein